MVTDVGALKREYHGISPLFDDEVRLWQSRSPYELPPHEQRPYLTFKRIEHFYGGPEAIFNGPGNNEFVFPPAIINRALRDEKEAALRGDLHFDLPQFQLARHAFGNSKVDRIVERVVDKLEKATVVFGGALSGVAAFGYLGIYAAVTMINYFANNSTRETFNNTQAIQVGSDTFGVNTEHKSSALGNDIKGEYWRYDGDNNVFYCAVKKGTNANSTGLYAFSLLATSYEHNCSPVEDLAPDHRGKKLHREAYLAFLQIAKPDGNYTPAKVDEILEAKSDLTKAQNRYNAVRPNP